MDIQFIDYIQTPNQDKQLGIAAINYGDILLRFKVQQGKDGHGFFISPASHKIGDRYVGSFEIDSKREHDKIIEMVRENVQTRMNPSKYKDNVTAKDFDEVPF